MDIVMKCKNIGTYAQLMLRRKTQVVLVYAFLIVLIIVASRISPFFLTRGNITNLLISSIPLLFVAYAQTIAIMSGGVDISVGGVVSLANVIVAVVTENSIFLGVALALCAGMLAGGLNGVIITKGKQQPIIVTLAVALILEGLALYILHIPGGSVPRGFARGLTGTVGQIPVPLIIFVTVSIIIWFLLQKTRFGQSLRATGGNENAALSSGIKVDKIRIIAYMLSGLLAAFGGVYLACIMHSGDPTSGAPFALRSITTVVIGGTLLGGGRGGSIGTIAGVSIMMIINNLMNLARISGFYQFVVQGLLLILALALSSFEVKRQVKTVIQKSE